MTPRVSIVVPYLRAETTMERALVSVIDQTMPDWEVVAVSDGSTDGTRAVVERLAAKDTRIRSLACEVNRGPAHARNVGIEAARGDWIAVLDADDRYRSTRLESMLDAAGDHPVVVDSLAGVDPHDGSDAGVLFPSLAARLDIAAIASATAPESRYDYGYLKPMVRRDFVTARHIRYDARLRTAEDLVFLLECCAHAGFVATIDRAGYVYNLPASRKRLWARGTTHTVPRDRDVADGLERLVARVRDALDDRAVAAIERRVDALRAGAVVADFRHDVLQRRFGGAARRFLRSPNVRRHVYGVLRRKLRLASPS